MNVYIHPFRLKKKRALWIHVKTHAPVAVVELWYRSFFSLHSPYVIAQLIRTWCVCTIIYSLGGFSSVSIGSGCIVTLTNCSLLFARCENTHRNTTDTAYHIQLHSAHQMPPVSSATYVTNVYTLRLSHALAPFPSTSISAPSSAKSAIALRIFTTGRSSSSATSKPRETPARFLPSTTVSSSRFKASD